MSTQVSAKSKATVEDLYRVPEQANSLKPSLPCRAGDFRWMSFSVD